MRWTCHVIIYVCTYIGIWVAVRGIYSCKFELCTPHALILMSESKISSTAKMSCHLYKIHTEAFWRELACKYNSLFQGYSHSWYFLAKCGWNLGGYFGSSWPECCFFNSKLCVKINCSTPDWFSLYVWEWHHRHILHAWP